MMTKMTNKTVNAGKWNEIHLLELFCPFASEDDDDEVAIIYVYSNIIPSLD